MKNKSLTPMMRQYLEIKEKYKDCILLFRLGDFYETFFEDARVISEELQLVLTSRNGHPMAGVPYHALDQYVKKLISAGYKVAICDQVEDPATAKGLVKREVTRVITPGTLIEDDLLSSEENNFIAAVSEEKGVFPFVIADISTGDVAVTSCESLSDLKDVLYRTAPSQLIMNEKLKPLKKEITGELSNVFLEFLEEWHFAYSSSVEYVKRFYELASIDALEISSAEIIVLGALFKYIEMTQFKPLKHLSLPRVLRRSGYMYLDASTIENLSILPSERRGSLYQTLKATVTSMGGRKLKEWLLNPLKDLGKIERRLDIVEAFYSDPLLLEELREYLRQAFDIERISSRLATGRAIPRDLQALRTTLQVLPLIKELLYSNDVLSVIAEDIELFEEERKLLEPSISDEPAAAPGEGKVIRRGYSEELDELMDLLEHSQDKMKEFELRERQKTGINNLKVKYNKVFGYFIEVSKGQVSRVPDDYIRKQTLVNSERYITPELKEFEDKVLSASERVAVLERALYEDICQKLSNSVQRFRKAGGLLAELDVLQSFATVAKKCGYTRPVFSSNHTSYVEAARHPVVEHYVKDFVPNDIQFDEKHSFYILTGPNMSGKSTYIRQVALISLMAQVGSFVPAKRAILPVYDRIFTRIGARDDVAGGKSTFLVEMMETATILSQATEDSLVVLDEVGRGTSTFDGISIAWAVSEYIYEAIGCHTIFATHFTELTELSQMYEGINNKTIEVREIEDGVIFLHKVVDGVASQSHGIDVAKLAGLPDIVLQRAREILKIIVKTSALDKTVKVLSSDEIKEIRKKKKGKMHKNQMSLF